MGEGYLQGLGALWPRQLQSTTYLPQSRAKSKGVTQCLETPRGMGSNSNSKLRCQHERTRSSPGHHSPALFLTGGASWLPPQSTLRWPQGVRHHGAGQMQGLFQYQPGNLQFLGVSIHSTCSANRSWTLAPPLRFFFFPYCK